MVYTVLVIKCPIDDTQCLLRHFIANRLSVYVEWITCRHLRRIQARKCLLLIICVDGRSNGINRIVAKPSKS